MAYYELVVSADNMVGTFKWIIRETVNGEKKPVQVYLESAHIDVKPGHDEDEDGRPYKNVVSVTTKYKVSKGKYLWSIPEDEIYDTKDEAAKALENNPKYK